MFSRFCPPCAAATRPDAPRLISQGQGRQIVDPDRLALAGQNSNMKTNHPCRHLVNLALAAALCAALPAFADGPKLPGIGAAMQEMIAKNEIAGAVTVVVTKDKLLHLESTGFADVAAWLVRVAAAPTTPGGWVQNAGVADPVG